VSYRTTENKKPYAIAGKLTAATMFREKCAQQLRDVPLSNCTVSRWIADISEGLQQLLIEKLRSELFSNTE
jgi:hypothetical protein